jgi:DNA polymerase III subunit alpha
LPSGKKNGAKEAAPVVSPVQKPYLGSIRYGLAAIKNVGEAAMIAAVAERKKSGAFKSVDDFCGRVDSKKINRKAVECLIKCGAFDFTKMERARMFAEVEGAMAAAASAHRDRAAGQVSLFGDMTTVATPASNRRNGPVIAPWPLSEALAYEKELLGFYGPATRSTNTGENSRRRNTRQSLAWANRKARAQLRSRGSSRSWKRSLRRRTANLSPWSCWKISPTKSR